MVPPHALVQSCLLTHIFGTGLPLPLFRNIHVKFLFRCTVHTNATVNPDTLFLPHLTLKILNSMYTPLSRKDKAR
jgi:hypothetical protein